MITIPNLNAKVYDLQNFKIPFFEELNAQTRMGEYSKEINLNDHKFPLTLNLGETQIDDKTMYFVLNTLEKIEEIDALMLKYIKNDFKIKGVAHEYIKHFLEYGGKEWFDSLTKDANKKQTKALQLLSTIKIKFFQIRLERDEKYIWVDYTFGGVVGGYVLTARFNLNGEMYEFTMES
jgi:Protein of unknown function (DUF2004)